MSPGFKFQCINCKQNLEADESMLGEFVDCPNCKARIEVQLPVKGQVRISSDSSPQRVITEVSPDNTSSLLCGILGSLVLMVGVFMPIVKIPIAGSINYFRNGEGDGVIVLILALISLLITLSRHFKWLYLTALPSLCIMAFTFIQFRARMSELIGNMDADLAGNPFRGLADAMVQTVELQWGWGVLLSGVILLLISASLMKKPS